MAGKGPPPKKGRRRSNKPIRNEWKAAPGVGWQHGRIPRAPTGLKAASRTAWMTWMKAWFAAHWTPDQLPGLRTVVLLYDQVERGEFHRAGELRIHMDTYGITPKGQQDRRWEPPKTDEPDETMPAASKGKPERYRHLQVVDGA